MEVHVKIEGRHDLSRQIYRQLRAAIHERRLVHGDRLPPTRELALRLDVSRNTVGLAYEWLTAEGLLTGRVGSGSFVESGPPLPARYRSATGEVIRARQVWAGLAGPGSRPTTSFDFGVGTPDVGMFPFDDWRRLMSRQLRRTRMSGEYGEPAGHPRLREAVARHVGVARGVRCSAEDVMICNGAQQAFDRIARVLIEPGARVAVEEPGYPPPRLLFESLGAKVSAVAVDAEGLVVAALPNDVRLVYVTPSHQFPLGMPMSHARRLALLAWAESRSAVVIEDDYDSEFRFGGRPLETLQAMDRTGRVLYVGSFSKVMLPSLRLGFLIAPVSLQRAFRAASYVSGWHGPWPEQAALASFIDDGLLARHIRRMRREYQARHDRILEILSRDFSDWLDPIPSTTGMHLCATLRKPSVRREEELHLRAGEVDVGFDRLSMYCTARPARSGIVLGYGAIGMSKLDEGFRRLRNCFTAAMRA